MRALITNIKIKEGPDDNFRKWYWTEGDFTGREDSFWMEIKDWTDNEFIDRVLNEMNGLIICSHEKKIHNPFSISFDAKTPRDSEGYNNIDKWYTRHFSR